MESAEAHAAYPVAVWAGSLPGSITQEAPPLVLKTLREAVSFSSEGAVKATVAAGVHSRLAVWSLEPGQEIHPHAHGGDHAWIVQEGRGWFLSNGQEHRVEPGSLIFAPAGEVHGIRAETRLVFASVTAG